MKLDELIEKLTEIKLEHEHYGKLDIIRKTKKDNTKDLVDIRVKFGNCVIMRDSIILEFD